LPFYQGVGEEEEEEDKGQKGIYCFMNGGDVRQHNNENPITKTGDKKS